MHTRIFALIWKYIYMLSSHDQHPMWDYLEYCNGFLNAALLPSQKGTNERSLHVLVTEKYELVDGKLSSSSVIASNFPFSSFFRFKERCCKRSSLSSLDLNISHLKQNRVCDRQDWDKPWWWCCKSLRTLDCTLFANMPRKSRITQKAHARNGFWPITLLLGQLWVRNIYLFIYELCCCYQNTFW